MTDLSFQNRLQIYGYRLSKSEQKIASFIVEQPAKAATISSQALSQAIGTSVSTLTRFCQKLEYRNYVEFQTLLSSGLLPNQVPDSVFHLLHNYYSRTLEAACELVTQDCLNNFVSYIQNANRILVFGLGSSGLTASELNMRLVQMGFTSSVMIDAVLMRAQSSLFSPSDLIIAVSNSGQTPEVVTACRIAKSANVKICLLTQNVQSDLGKMADAILVACDVGQMGDEQFINSQMPLMFLIDAITYQLLNEPKCKDSRTRALQTLLHRNT